MLEGVPFRGRECVIGCKEIATSLSALAMTFHLLTHSPVTRYARATSSNLEEEFLYTSKNNKSLRGGQRPTW